MIRILFVTVLFSRDVLGHWLCRSRPSDPEIEEPPSQVISGKNVTYTCKSESANPSTTVKWYINNILKDASFDVHGGTYTNSYTFLAEPSLHYSVLECRVWNNCVYSLKDTKTIYVYKECNVAFHKQTCQSSTYNHDARNDDPVGHSCNAVDGNTITHYFLGSCSHTLDDPSLTLHSWTIDLGATYRVERIALYLRTDGEHYERFRDVTIDLYNGMYTPSDQILCKYYQGPPPQNFTNPLDIRCDNRESGTFLKIYKNSTTSLELCEVQVFAILDACPEPPLSWTCGNQSYAPTTTCDTTDSEITTSEREGTNMQSQTIDTTDLMAASQPVTSQPVQEISMQVETSARSTALVTANHETSITHSHESEEPPRRSTNLMITNRQNPITYAQRPSTELQVNPSSGITDLIPSNQPMTTNSRQGSTSTSNDGECLCPCSSLGSRGHLYLTVEEILEKMADVLEDIKIDKKKTKMAQNKLVCAKDDRTSSKKIGMVGIVFISIVVGIVILMDIHILIECLENKKRRTNRRNESSA